MPETPGWNCGAAASETARESLALLFPGASAPILLTRAPEIAGGLAQALKGWRPRLRPARPEDFAAPLAAARPDAGGYEIASRALERPLTGLPLASAVSALVADLAQDFYESRPGFLGLHCGAFLAPQGLALLLGPQKAGKSTLIARLSAEPGLRIFCDDVLPLTPQGEGLALGAAPRLRLPLPAGAGSALRAHLARHGGFRDDRYAHLTAPGLAPFGARAPLAALVVLERRRGVRPALSLMPSEEAAAHLQAQSMGQPQPETAARMAKLAGSLLRLTYADLEPAAALLRRRFLAAPPPLWGRLLKRLRPFAEKR